MRPFAHVFATRSFDPPDRSALVYSAHANALAFPVRPHATGAVTVALLAGVGIVGIVNFVSYPF
jgi:hypothetical protein